MRVSDLSIKNPVFAWMLMMALIVFGGISFTRLGISQLPDVDFPVLTVSVNLLGASPEIMETTVVDPIEDALTSVEGVKSISSSSKNGNATITIEFNLEKNIDVALQDVQTRVAQAQKRLPKDIDPPIITKTNPDDQPIIWLAIQSKSNDRRALAKFSSDYLKDQFTIVPGVGDVMFGGYSDPVYKVQVKQDSLQRHNITVNDVIDAIQTEHNEVPGGQVDTDKKTFNVRVMGESPTIEDFKKIVITKRAGVLISDPAMMVRLEQVADIVPALADYKRLSRFNGELAMGLGIKKQRGSNAVDVARAVKARMNEIQSKLPEGMSLSVNFDTTRFIEQSIHELNKHLVLAVILTSLVCWMFLGSWSATFNVLLSIPTSLMGAFIGLYFMGFTLNTFTLLGLTLAIGIVVDDAIMVLENIFRYNEMGHKKIESAILGSREITFAAIAATAAVVAIFLPVAFMKGVIGKFFLQFGMTISLAVVLSLLESLTITPMRCASFVASTHRTTKLGLAFEDFMTWLENTYKRQLAFTLKYKWIVVIGSLVAMFLSFGLLKFIPKEFTPAQESGLLIARLQYPVGTSFEFNNQNTKKAEEWVRAQEPIKQVYASIGGFSMNAAESNMAIMFLAMKPRDERKMTQTEFQAIARKEISKLTGAKAFLMDPTARGFGGTGKGYPVEFMIQGADWGELAAQATEIMKAMEASGKMIDVDSNYLLGQPEIQLIPNRFNSAQSGVSMSNLGKTVGSLIGGSRVGQFAEGGRRYDVYIELQKNNDQLKELKTLSVANSKGNFVPISKLVEEKQVDSLQSINRYNRMRAITIYSNLAPGVSQQQALDEVQNISKKILKPGYIFGNTGSSQDMKESFQGLILALILGLIVAYMILASQFNSFIDPFTILMALPYSISGAFLALMITAQSVNIYSMIGVLLLMGIVKKNSILLVEFTNTVRDRGVKEAIDALIQACPVRLRPILMTSFATIAGAIPSALARGDGSETVRPMAITLIGGVIVSTALTLLVIPSLYAILDKIRNRESSRDATLKAFENVGNQNL